MRSDIYRLIFLLIALAMSSAVPAGAQGNALKTRRFHDVGVEMRWSWAGQPLVFGEPQGTSKLSIARADFLISQLALRRADGTWMESSQWFANFRGNEGRNRAKLEGVPAQTYTGLRFQLGVDETTDKADPNQWPAGHALHPLVNGLHWGWLGGYIYMALEGHFPGPAGAKEGFSYHLAGASQRSLIELDGCIDLTAGGTVAVQLDLAKALGGVEPASFGESTHSREGDTRATVLKGRVAGAFSLAGVMPDLWQDAVITASTPTPKRGTPFPLHISNRLPQVKLPPDNLPTLEGVALGRRLFHENRLSRTNTQACASCHQASAAFTDAGRRFSLGVDGQEGTRNAMPLFNLAWQEDFFWDGRSKGLRNQVLLPIQDPVEMHESLDRVKEKLSADPAYAAEYTQVFGTPDITPERTGLALEQFLLTLVSQDSKFDQALRRTTKLTVQEQRGLELFVTEHDPARNLRGADCFHCHSGALFTNQGFANNGLDSIPAAGRGAVTGLAADLGRMRVPSLRNIALTAPYMHDGRFATLEEVVEHYDSGVQRTATLDPNLAKHPAAGLGLSREDKAALVAFLHTLTDPAFATSPAGTFAAPSLTLSKP